MSGSGKAGNGRGNNRRRSFRRHGNENADARPNDGKFQENRPGGRSMDSKPGKHDNSHSHGDRNRGRHTEADSHSAPYVERQKWIPPKLNTDPLPNYDCPWCGKPIRDISQAIADRSTGVPIHFDCVAARISEGEILEKDDTVIYIGGGRFGIVSFNSDQKSDSPRGGRGMDAGDNARNHQGSMRNSPMDKNAPPVNNEFKIKKIIEWENKDRRADWRSEICDHYSVT